MVCVDPSMFGELVEEDTARGNATSSIIRGPPSYTSKKTRASMRRATTPVIGGSLVGTKISPLPPACDAASPSTKSRVNRRVPRAVDQDIPGLKDGEIWAQCISDVFLFFLKSQSG